MSTRRLGTRRLSRLAAAGALGIAGLGIASAPATAAPTPATSSATREVGSIGVYGRWGQVVDELTQRWWQWAMAQPLASNPNVGTDTSTCAQGQRGHIWYLPQTLTGQDAVRRCTLPPGTITVINMVGVLEDYPCPDPTFAPAPGQTLEDFLQRAADQALGQGTIDVRVDGRTVPNVMRHRTVGHGVCQ